jgi:hypothetical protein
MDLSFASLASYASRDPGGPQPTLSQFWDSMAQLCLASPPGLWCLLGGRNVTLASTVALRTPAPILSLIVFRAPWASTPAPLRFLPSLLVQLTTAPFTPPLSHQILITRSLPTLSTAARHQRVAHQMSSVGRWKMIRRVRDRSDH